MRRAFLVIGIGFLLFWWFVVFDFGDDTGSKVFAGAGDHSGGAHREGFLACLGEDGEDEAQFYETADQHAGDAAANDAGSAFQVMEVAFGSGVYVGLTA